MLSGRARGGQAQSSTESHDCNPLITLVMLSVLSRRARGNLHRLCILVWGVALAGLAMEEPYVTQAYSADGNAKALEGGPRPKMIPSSGNALQYSRHGALRLQISNLTGFESSSIFAETQALAHLLTCLSTFVFT